MTINEKINKIYNIIDKIQKIKEIEEKKLINLNNKIIDIEDIQNDILIYIEIIRYGKDLIKILNFKYKNNKIDKIIKNFIESNL